jgi:hypothetical protein
MYEGKNKQKKEKENGSWFGQEARWKTRRSPSTMPSAPETKEEPTILLAPHPPPPRARSVPQGRRASGPPDPLTRRCGETAFCRPVDSVPRVPPGRVVVPMASGCTIYFLGQGRQRSWRFWVNLRVASSLVSWPLAWESVVVRARRLLTLRMPWAPHGDQT